MNVLVEVSVRGIKRSDELERIIEDNVRKLERVCDYISSGRIVIQSSYKHHRQGNQCRVPACAPRA